jgi:hypothetical protein
VRDPADTAAEAALAEARRLLEIFHHRERSFLEPGRERRVATNDENMRARARLKIRRLEAAGVFSGEERARLVRLVDEDARRRPRGRRRNEVRDYWITVAVHRLGEKHGVAPSRSREPAPHRRQPASACAIVARVLRELGVGISERAVETIWSHRRPEDFWWEGGKMNKPTSRGVKPLNILGAVRNK